MHPIPEKMNGVELIGHGGYDQLILRDDICVPSPGPRDVLIRVRASAVNNTDLNTRVGWYSKSGGDSSDAGWSGNAIEFPLIQGADVCGQVVAVGKDVDAKRVGERVLVEPSMIELNSELLQQPKYLGSDCNGGFAEYTVVASRHAHAIHSEHSDVELATFPCSYSTAENLLTRAGVTGDDRVLVTGASGGVGSAVVQLAKARGAEVIAITSPQKAEKTGKLGANYTLSRDADLLAELGANSIDVVVDLVAGEKWPVLLDVLRPRGRYATSGAIAGPIVELDVRTLYLKDLTLFGCTVLDDGVFANLIKRIEAGDIKPLVAASFPLAQIVDAQKLFETKQHIGKIGILV